MKRALTAGIACLLLMASPARAGTAAATLPLLQSWTDRGQITRDDDWSRVSGIVGYRGDGLATEPGTDPRGVSADGSGTPVDVAASLTDPRAVGLAAGVAEFELADPVVAIQGSATASAPHLVMALDTRGRSGVAVRLLLRDIDATAHDAVEPVAVQYRVGGAGAFAAMPGGYVADATSGPGAATRVTPVRAELPAAASGQPLVQVRVITTNAVGQDEWVGIDNIEVSAASSGGCPGPGPGPGPAPGPGPGPGPTPGGPGPPPGPGPGPGPTPGGPGPAPPPDPRPKPMPRPNAPAARPELTGLELAPATFVPAKRGPAIARGGRVGAALRFRLSRPAQVRFEVLPASPAVDFAPKRWTARPDARFSARGRRGLNRLRFSGRVRGRPLAAGPYVLRAVAVDRAGRSSPPVSVRFRIAQSSRTSAPPGENVTRRIWQSGASVFRRSTRPPVCCQWHQNNTVGPAPEIVAPTAPSCSACSTSSIERG
jgi:hypothetical protein